MASSIFFIGFLARAKGFTAAVLGGIGSLPGATLGGVLIGLIEAFWPGYFSVEYKDVSVSWSSSSCWSSVRRVCSAGPNWGKYDDAASGLAVGKEALSTLDWAALP